MFKNHEVPIAYSMIRLVRETVGQMREPFHEYLCYWMAFNNIYTTVSDNFGRSRQLRNDNGIVQTRLVGNLIMPRVYGPSERDQLETVFQHFSEDLKHKLIEHQNTRFFVERSPKWRGKNIEFDDRGQRLNGVLNISSTLDCRYPTWSPIDINLYEQYIRDKNDVESIDILANQILNLLYTVRNNTFHGGKRIDDANDRHVIEKATPLLALIVNHFLSDTI